MSRLYLRLPSKSVAEAATHGRGLVCRYALVASGGVEREGVAALSELSATLGKVDRVVLLVAASDVTLLRLRVPPLSAARLKAALPNLVEEHLIADPAECVIVAGAASGDMRTIAVMQRDWMEAIAKAVGAHSPRRMSAVPAQLCLPYRPGTVSAAIDHGADEIELTVRLAEQEGIGIAMAPGSSAADVLEALGAVARDAPVTLYVPDGLLDAYRGASHAMPELAQRVTFVRDEWSGWLEGVDSAGLDLVTGLGARYTGQADLRQWRWPMALAAGVVAINLTGLYVDWWRMRSEADRLRAGMIQTFKSAYPKESVVLDPVAQMRQKNAAAQRAAGQLAPHDFLVLLSGFGDAWARVRQAEPAKSPPIASLEYRDRTLLVRPKPEAQMPTEQLKAALDASGLSLSQPAAGTWQVRSGK